MFAQKGLYENPICFKIMDGYPQPFELIACDESLKKGCDESPISRREYCNKVKFLKICLN